MNRLALLVVAFALVAPLPARAIDGFTFGLEYARGPWDADQTELGAKAIGGLGSAESFLFTSALAGETRNGLHLHLGWNVLGHALIEGTFQTSFWKPFSGDSRGGVGLAGGRLTWMPLELAAQLTKKDILLERFWDLGLEFGLGYSIGGAKLASNVARGMDGTYTSFGVMGEVWHPKVRFVSLVLGWRYFRPSWNRYYMNFDDNIGVDVDGFNPGWNTFNLGLSFHAGASK
jgi:hypothetical protein